jgi:Asp-tRNA(Asn)/Glu-tRNA(Gln) amidotransferase A subunit family amidase
MTDTTPNGLLDAFWRYEAALMSNNLGELDRLFAPGPWTLRGDAVGLLVGHDAISAFRAGRGGAPARSVEELHVRAIDDDAAMIVAVVRAASGGRGQQTQLWRRGVDGWQVAVAHVSAPARVVDGTIWRIVGTPLVAGTPGGAAADEADAADAPDSARNAAGDSAGAPEPGLSGREAGSLDGETVAVKDLFAIAGFAVGAGVPAYLAEGRPATETASAVASLLAAGADVVGIARTDEFAYSIAGRNPHYGTPPNAAVPGALPGGSSSGPASAVALGQASIGLATDTGGSIRVPASYQGLWGLRTTHGAVPVDGLLPLAPSFDTVGWLTRDGSTLARAARASIPGVRRELTPRYALVDVSAAFQGEGQAGAGDGQGGEVERAVGEAAARLRAAGIDVDTEPVDVGDLAELAESFRQVQAFEAWGTHGAWIRQHPGALGDEIAARFGAASAVGAEEAGGALRRLHAHAARIAALAEDRILLLPSAASGAPDARATPAQLERVRSATMRLTCIAGSAGLPALSVPALSVTSVHGGRAPFGLCLVGARGSDLALIERGREVAAALTV